MSLLVTRATINDPSGVAGKPNCSQKCGFDAFGVQAGCVFLSSTVSIDLGNKPVSEENQLGSNRLMVSVDDLEV